MADDVIVKWSPGAQNKLLNDYPDTYNLSPEQLDTLNKTGPAKFGFNGK